MSVCVCIHKTYINIYIYACDILLSCVGIFMSLYLSLSLSLSRSPFEGPSVAEAEQAFHVVSSYCSVSHRYFAGPRFSTSSRRKNNNSTTCKNCWLVLSEFYYAHYRSIMDNKQKRGIYTQIYTLLSLIYIILYPKIISQNHLPIFLSFCLGIWLNPHRKIPIEKIRGAGTMPSTWAPPRWPPPPRCSRRRPSSATICS